MRRYSGLVILFLLFSSVEYCYSFQLDTSKHKVVWDFGFRTYMQTSTGSEYNMPVRAVFPTDPQLLRRGDNNGLRSLWELNNSFATDNPLYHYPIEIHLQAETQYSHWLKLQVRGIVEHRGMSYGSYNQNNIAIYPLYQIHAQHSWKIKRDSLKLSYKQGHFINFSLGERLTIYNIDVHADILSLKYKKINLEITQISDLFQGIGLNTDDAFHSNIKYLSRLKNYEWENGIGHVFNASSGLAPYNLKPFNSVEFFSALHNKSFKIYSHFSYRYNTLNNEGDHIEKSAGIIGFSMKYKSPRVNIRIRNEYRHYGTVYNSWFINTNVYYRERNSVYNNTVGPNLYPLMRYDRPFSQWAVFTEYQYSQINVVSFESQIDFKLNDWLSIWLNTDLTCLFPEKASNFLYPFFEGGFLFKVEDQYDLLIGISNKGMNLDKHYPTHYRFEYPLIHFRFQKYLTKVSTFDWL